jgi:predicted small metal-binding protein
MLQKYAALVLAVILALMFSSNTYAQDVKKDVKKETKPAVVTPATKDVKQETKPAVAKQQKDAKKSTKPATMKYVSCSQAGCGFWAKSHSAKELRYIMKRHAKKYHKVQLTDAQLKEMVKKEGTK